jgi:CTP:molybdopterin cytidylyltransferase MocA
MVVRVIRTLQDSGCVDTILVCGPAAGILQEAPQLRDLVDGKRVRWIAPLGSPSASAAAALGALPEDQPVLLTTGDHPLLSREMVRHFLSEASAGSLDVAVALAPYDVVQQAYPRTRRTALKFSDGRYCGCNLFAFLTPRGRGMVPLWKKVEAHRKQPIRVVGLVGWVAMFLYALGILSLAGAMRRISRQTGLAVGVVTMPFPEAAIDVDSVADLDLARDIAAQAR